MAQIAIINKWNVCVIFVAIYNPPYKPIPLYEKATFKLDAFINAYINITIATLQ